MACFYIDFKNVLYEVSAGMLSYYLKYFASCSHLLLLLRLPWIIKIIVIIYIILVLLLACELHCYFILSIWNNIYTMVFSTILFVTMLFKYIVYEFSWQWVHSNIVFSAPNPLLPPTSRSLLLCTQSTAATPWSPALATPPSTPELCYPSKCDSCSALTTPPVSPISCLHPQYKSIPNTTSRILTVNQRKERDEVSKHSLKSFCIGRIILSRSAAIVRLIVSITFVNLRPWISCFYYICKCCIIG